MLELQSNEAIRVETIRADSKAYSKTSFAHQQYPVTGYLDLLRLRTVVMPLNAA